MKFKNFNSKIGSCMSAVTCRSSFWQKLQMVFRLKIFYLKFEYRFQKKLLDGGVLQGIASNSWGIPKVGMFWPTWKTLSSHFYLFF